jgi:hypothetical protein
MFVMIPPWRPHLPQQGQIILDTPIIGHPAVLDLDRSHRDDGNRLTSPWIARNLPLFQNS